MSHDEKIVSLLSEIRDIQKLQLEKNQEYIKRYEDRQKKYYRQILIIFVIVFTIIIILR